MLFQAGDELKDAFLVMDEDKNGFVDWMEFLKWATIDDTVMDTLTQMTLSPAVRRMNEIRKALTRKKNLFFGFTFAQWKKASALDKSNVRSWTPNDVMLFVATHPDLKVVDAWITCE